MKGNDGARSGRVQVRPGSTSPNRTSVETRMRRALLACLLSVAVTAAPRPAMAQGWIIPRPCIMDVVPIRGDVRPMPVRDCGANIARTRSDVHVELADRVLRYEVEERFINRGGSVGEADYLFPLPERRRVSGPQAVDQRRARRRRDDERRRRAPHL